MFTSRQLDHRTPAMRSPAAAIDHPATAQPGLRLARSRIVHRTTKLLSYGALAAITGILLVVAAATLPVFFGYHTYVINGSSMEPALELGSVAITSPTNPRGLEVGDIIAYRKSPENPPVLHRIVQITTDDTGQPSFLTQGDQNRTPDPHPTVLQGNGDRVVYTVPYAGYILNFAQSIPGRILLLAVPAIVLVMMRVWPGKRLRRPSRAQTEAAPADVAIRPPIEAAAPAQVAVRLANVPSMAKALRRQEDEKREPAPSHPAAPAVVHPTNVMPIERRLAQAERREIAASDPPPWGFDSGRPATTPADASVQPPSVTAIAERLGQTEAERREIAASDAPPRAAFDTGRPIAAPGDAPVQPPDVTVTATAERLAEAEKQEIAASDPPPPAPSWPSLEAQAEQRSLRPTPTRLSLEAQAVRLRLFQHPAVRRGT